MRYTEFLSFVRKSTQTDENTFPEEDVVLFANVYKNDFVKDIVKINEDLFGMPMTVPLVAGQREYAFPDEAIKVKQLEAKLDGIKWQKLYETDMAIESFATDEDSIRSAFSQRAPAYEIFRRSFTIYSHVPIIDVDAGLKMSAIIYPADFTDFSSSTDMSVDPTDTSAGFPGEFHLLLARRVSIAYKESQDIAIPLTDSELGFARSYASALKAISDTNLARSYRTEVPRTTGYNY